MNEKAQHTQGPWRFDGTHIKHTSIYVASTCQGPVNGEHGKKVEAANGHLIAAAPEMLEMLIQISKILNSPEIEAIIAKAKGQPDA